MDQIIKTAHDTRRMAQGKKAAGVRHHATGRKRQKTKVKR
jgi:hypothetical protein